MAKLWDVVDRQVMEYGGHVMESGGHVRESGGLVRDSGGRDKGRRWTN